MTEARTTQIKMTYEGRNITAEISPYILTFTYTDNSGGKSDDITLSLEDRRGLWLTDWKPTKGDKLQCSIVTGKTSLPCGEYEVDEISYAMPPRVMTIKAVSTAITRRIAGEKHSRAWENVKIRTIAGDIASRGNLALFYDVDNDYYLERREQINQSDLEFLKSICSDYDLNVKVSDGKLIIYSGEKYEQKASVTELGITDERLISANFRSKSAQVYKKAKVKYHNAVKNKTYEVEYADDSTEGTGRELVINEYVENEGQARTLAKKRLRKANAREVTGTLTLMGDVRLLSGVNITLTGFGIFSGKYALTKATHSVTSSGYTTVIEVQQGTSSKTSNKQKKQKRDKRVKRGGLKELYYEGDKYYGSK